MCEPSPIKPLLLLSRAHGDYSSPVVMVMVVVVAVMVVVVSLLCCTMKEGSSCCEGWGSYEGCAKDNRRERSDGQEAASWINAGCGETRILWMCERRRVMLFSLGRGTTNAIAAVGKML